MRHKARGSQEKLRYKACDAAEDAKPDARETREHVEKKQNKKGTIAGRIPITQGATARGSRCTLGNTALESRSA